MTRITLLHPVTYHGEPDNDAVIAAQAAGVELEEIYLDEGPEEIVTEIDCADATQQLIANARKAEANGSEGMVINCMSDPALFAVREAVSVPVVGSAEAAIQWARSLGGTIAWIDVAYSSRSIVQRQFGMYGGTERYVGFTAIDIRPIELTSDPEKVFERLCLSARDLVANTGASSIILGCTLLTDMRVRLEQWLEEEFKENGERFHIVVGMPLAISTAALMAHQGLRHF